MSTTTTTDTKVVVKVAAEVVKAYATFTDLAAKVDQSFLAVGLSGLKAAQRQGYTDKADVSSMFRLSIYEQEGVSSLDDADPKKVAVADRIKTNVSMWTAIVVCKDEPSQKERDKAISYNDALPKGHKPNLRIGQKLMLDICRGQSTADDIIAVKEGREPVNPATRASGQTPKGESAGNANAANGGSNPDAANPSETSQSAPESQNASLPSPSGTEKPVGSPEDAMRVNLKTATQAYINNLGLTKERVAAILREIADSLLAA